MRAQDNPLQQSADVRGIPVLTLDVWEHAYYLKYNASRPSYIKNWCAARPAAVQRSAESFTAGHTLWLVRQVRSWLRWCADAAPVLPAYPTWWPTRAPSLGHGRGCKGS